MALVHPKLVRDYSESEILLERLQTHVSQQSPSPSPVPDFAIFPSPIDSSMADYGTPAFDRETNEYFHNLDERFLRTCEKPQNASIYDSSRTITFGVDNQTNIEPVPLYMGLFGYGLDNPHQSMGLWHRPGDKFEFEIKWHKYPAYNVDLDAKYREVQEILVPLMGPMSKFSLFFFIAIAYCDYLRHFTSFDDSSTLPSLDLGLGNPLIIDDIPLQDRLHDDAISFVRMSLAFITKGPDGIWRAGNGLVIAPLKTNTKYAPPIPPPTPPYDISEWLAEDCLSNGSESEDFAITPDDHDSEGSELDDLFSEYSGSSGYGGASNCS